MAKNKKVEVEKVKVRRIKVVKEDRSAFNCETCKGLGLVGDPESALSSICSVCKGTGKV